MTCSKDVKQYPNACSGNLTGQVTLVRSHLPVIPGDKVQDLPSDMIRKKLPFTYGFALYFYSSYQEKDAQIHEVINASFALDTDGLCFIEYKFASGQCFGMSANQSARPVEDPPRAPTLEGILPKLSQVYARHPPKKHRMFIAWVLTVLLLLALGGAAGFYVYQRQRLVEEEQVLRTQEVELS
eukprot:Skav224652  [mRNA]  locus=scaffold4300:107584:108132:+ [translate_table: standard]